MEYLLIILVIFYFIKKWLKQKTIKQLIKKHRSHVVLYSATWCVNCQKTKALLDNQMVAYVVFDIDKSQQAHAEFKSLGCRRVPVVIINGIVVQGYDPQKIERLI